MDNNKYIKIHKKPYKNIKYYKAYLYTNKDLCLKLDKIWNYLINHNINECCSLWLDFSEYYISVKKLLNYNPNRIINNELELKTYTGLYNSEDCYWKSKKYTIGDIYKTNSDKLYQIIDKLPNKKYRIKFLDSGIVRTIHSTQISSREIKEKETK